MNPLSIEVLAKRVAEIERDATLSDEAKQEQIYNEFDQLTDAVRETILTQTQQKLDALKSSITDGSSQDVVELNVLHQRLSEYENSGYVGGAKDVYEGTGKLLGSGSGDSAGIIGETVDNTKYLGGKFEEYRKNHPLAALLYLVPIAGVWGLSRLGTSAEAIEAKKKLTGWDKTKKFALKAGLVVFGAWVFNKIVGSMRRGEEQEQTDTAAVASASASANETEKENVVQVAQTNTQAQPDPQAIAGTTPTNAADPDMRTAA